MKARFFILSVLAAGLALVLVWTVAAQGTETKPQLLSNSQPVSALEDYQNQEKAANPGTHPGITLIQSFPVYLPLVQRDYSPPCTFAPTLISPTNGSALDTLVPTLSYMRGTDPVSYTDITIADNPAFDAPIEYTSSGGGIGPHQLRLFDNLEPATKYYWRMYDMCELGTKPLLFNLLFCYWFRWDYFACTDSRKPGRWRGWDRTNNDPDMGCCRGRCRIRTLSMR